MTTFGFDQLAGAAACIARHSETPEKPLAVRECLDDIENRYAERTLSPEQRKRLVAILLGLDARPSDLSGKAEAILQQRPDIGLKSRRKS